MLTVRMRAARAGALVAALTPAAQAVTTTWLPAGGGSWEEPANWSNGVPGR